MLNTPFVRYFATAADRRLSYPPGNATAARTRIRARPSRSGFPPIALTTAILFGAVLLLAIVSVTLHGLQYYQGADRYAQLVRLFNLSGEGNIPAWFSSMLLFGCALLLAVIADEVSQRELPYLGHWWLLAAIFLYLSMDEASEIHEMANQPLRSMVHARGLLYQAWVLPAISFLSLFLASYVRFLKHLPRRTAILFILSGATFVAGAVGMEMVSNYVQDYHANWMVVRGGLATLEDFLEMTGLVLFIYTLLSYRAETAHH